MMLYWPMRWSVLALSGIPPARALGAAAAEAMLEVLSPWMRISGLRDEGLFTVTRLRRIWEELREMESSPSSLA